MNQTTANEAVRGKGRRSDIDLVENLVLELRFGDTSSHSGSTADTTSDGLEEVIGVVGTRPL